MIAKNDFVFHASMLQLWHIERKREQAMKRKALSILSTLAIALVLVALSGIVAMADETTKTCPECGSQNTESYVWGSNKIDANLHENIYQFKCNSCGHWWQTKGTEAHDWDYNGITGYKKYNSSNHYVVKEYRCSACGQTENRDVLEKHIIGNIIEECKYYSADSHKKYETGKCIQCDAQASIYVATKKHNWVQIQTEKGEDYAYDYSTTGKHIRYSYWQCNDCEKVKTKSSTRDHVIGRDKVCTKCKYPTTSQTLVEGKYAYKSGRPYLKIVVKEAGYITITQKGDVRLELLKGDKTTYCDYYKTRVPVKKGTYYLRNCKRTSNENFKVKYTFKKMPPNQDNTTMKKAYKLKPGKAVTAVQFFKDKDWYFRYYKITLTKSSYISLLKPYGGAIDIYDANGKWYAEDRHKKGDKYVSTKKLKKGTYYIELWLDKDTGSEAGDVVKLQWNYEK